VDPRLILHEFMYVMNSYFKRIHIYILTFVLFEFII
jgi:hypothetical protein